jgi:hypothetical protein
VFLELVHTVSMSASVALCFKIITTVTSLSSVNAFS